MAKTKTFTVNVLEHSQISPPPFSAPKTSLPLTFFDLPWLFFPPSQRLFFYEFPFPISHFTSTTIPNLKRSLSLTLRHHFPFAGNLNLPPKPGRPEIFYADGNWVSLTVAQSNQDFNRLVANYSRFVNEFYPLVPELSSKSLPLLALQITHFPDSAGICIGFAYHHAVADERTFNNFIKTWASVCNFSIKSPPLPFLDRAVIKDPHGLQEIFLNEWRNRKSSREICTDSDLADSVRSTFVVGLNDMNRIKQWIIAECSRKNQTLPLHLSPYVLTCAFLWVCLIKTQVGGAAGEDPNYFGFVAGGLTRLEYPVPATYLGNCVGFGRSAASRNELLGDDGIVVAAKAIGDKIKKLDKEIFGGAERWISDWEEMLGSELHVVVVGSPKVDLYETDFGWGRPKKIEDISIDRMRGVWLGESRDGRGGIEIGLVLSKPKMDAFTSFFHEGLKAFS